MATAPAKPPSSDEAALIRRVLAGERDRFYELVQPYERAAYLTAFSIVQNEGDAEDAAQEAVLKALKNLKHFRGESKFSTWLLQIVINEARMRLRKDRRHLYQSLDERSDDGEEEYSPKDYADWREIPSEALARKELRQALEHAIATLPAMYREVLMLRDVQHRSIAETAELLAITPASVKTRLLRARLRVRDALAPGFDGSWTAGERDGKKVRPWQ